MTASGSDGDGTAGVDTEVEAEVEIGRAPSTALGQVIVSTLQGEGIRARLSGTRIMVPGRFQAKARDILDFLRSQIAKTSR